MSTLVFRGESGERLPLDVPAKSWTLVRFVDRQRAQTLHSGVEIAAFLQQEVVE
jgi:hypothetical protein